MTLKILAAIALFAGAAAPSAQEMTADQAGFVLACRISGYDCRGLKVPMIVMAPLTGLYGRYRMGDPYILLNEKTPRELAAAVVVHEMTHYLQYKNGAWTFTPANRCAMEKEAFDVSNVVLARSGALEFIVDWEKAKVWYGCEKQNPEVVQHGKFELPSEGTADVKAEGHRR